MRAGSSSASWRARMGVSASRSASCSAPNGRAWASSRPRPQLTCAPRQARARCDLAQQPALALAGLARQQHQPARAGQRLLDRIPSPRPARLPTNQRHILKDARPRSSPASARAGAGCGAAGARAAPRTGSASRPPARPPARCPAARGTARTPAARRRCGPAGGTAASARGGPPRAAGRPAPAAARSAAPDRRPGAAWSAASSRWSALRYCSRKRSRS